VAGEKINADKRLWRTPRLEASVYGKTPV